MNRSLTAALLISCSDPKSSSEDTTASTSDFCEAIAPDADSSTSFYESNPTYDDSSTVGWTTGSPESNALESALESVANDLAERPIMWSFLVVRSDAIIFERYFNGATADDSNNVHSASKSILSTVTGIAIDRGDLSGLDQPLSELLPDHTDGIDADKAAINVGQLLTMSAGFEWTEDQSEYRLEDQEDWVRAILDLPLEDTPGESFNYSTAQSHLLSAALTEATGQSTCDYAHTHLLEPLGITAEHWGRDPQGYFSGGYNLYLTPRELARFGQLYLQGGVYEGDQLVPKAWTEAAVDPQINAGWGYSYGYLWWLWEPADEPIAIAWGYAGQLVYVIPDLDAVVVFTTNTRDYDIEFDAADLLEDTILPALRL